MKRTEEELKTLVTCKPSEFFEQTWKIASHIDKWLTVTDIQNISQRLPHKEFPTMDMSTEDKVELEKRNQEAIKKQQKENMFSILESMLSAHATETLEVLAYCCFIDPKDVDNYPMEMYLKAITELISNENVINFFIASTQLAQIFTVKV